MKCPKKEKNCSCSLIIKAKKNNFICSGVNKKPTKYKKDIIQLCLNGALSKPSIEMTVEEACFIISVLSTTLGFLAPGVIIKK